MTRGAVVTAIAFLTGPVTAGTVVDELGPESVLVGHGALDSGLPSIGIMLEGLPPADPENHLHPGLRQDVANFVFEPLGTFQKGESIPIELGPACAFTASATSDTGVFSVKPDFRLRARIVVGDISGDATSFIDLDVPPGLYTYKVTGVRDDKASFPSSAFLSTIRPPGSSLRGDADASGRINIVDPVATLGFLFAGGMRSPVRTERTRTTAGRSTSPIRSSR